jgi:hypothetical protein
MPLKKTATTTLAVVSPAASLKPTDSVAITDLAEALNIPSSAVIAAIENSRRTIKKAFYSIPELAKRWNCSRATVYNILRESESNLLNLSDRTKKRNRWSVPAAVVKRIEERRMEPLPEIAQPAA